MRNKKAKALRKIAKQYGNKDLPIEKKLTVSKKNKFGIDFQFIWPDKSIRKIYKTIKKVK